MRKVATLLTGLFTLAFLWVGIVHAVSVSVKISQPKSPSNQNSFDINVVTLDIEDRAITVKCFKKSPSDGGFSQFGSDIAIAAGGNSANCSVNSSVMPSEGTYQFYATAVAGADPVETSSTISVEYKISGGPDTPTEYSKEKPSSCTYKVKFKTADDAGKTVKVEIYRSESTSFNTDSGTRVGSINIGSNAQGELSNDVPDCNKTYYYAIRAFDSVGNGSGVRGDSETHTTTILVSPTPGGAQGAIAAGAAGNVLGQETQPTPAGDTLGEATPEAKVEEVTPSAQGPVQSLFTGISEHPVRSAGILGIILAILYYVIFRSPKP